MKRRISFYFVCIFFVVTVFSPSIYGQKDELSDQIFQQLEEEYSQKETKTKIADPLEPFNRFMFKVNDMVYMVVFKPVSKVYSFVVPKEMRKCIERAFDNLKFPIRFVNCLLQGRPKAAFKESCRFVINIVFGLFGLFPAADGVKALKREVPPQDTGLTLAKWGVGHGFYIVLPIIGPCSLRDGIGKIGDFFLDPTTYLEPWEVRWGVKGEEKLNYASLHLKEYEDLKKSSVDPYTAFKDFYIQYRESLLKVNKNVSRENLN